MIVSARRAEPRIDLGDALEIVSCSDPGRVRPQNEDSVLADSAIGLAVLADGMGGYNAGEVASGMATTVIATEMQGIFGKSATRARSADFGVEAVRQMLCEQVRRANATVYQAAQSQPQYAGMGTTLVASMFCDNRIIVAHIGDSRLYRLRAGRLEQITKDHSLLQEQIDSGVITREQARYSNHKNLVTRALGIDPTVEMDLTESDTQVGDIYLLCSDGLNDMVSDEEIEMTIDALSDNLSRAADQLVQLANDNGGHDNVSVILIRIVREFSAPRSLLERIRSQFKSS
jgi:PPM family protein phosphatase